MYSGLFFSAQDGMIAATGAAWVVHTFHTGHSPFLGEPEDLAKTIMGLAKLSRM